MTKSEFKKKAEAAFIRSNPTAIITGWTLEPRKVTYPTGVKEFMGKFHAIADGHRSREMLACADDDYVMVR
jgi:hypothetical protein